MNTKGSLAVVIFLILLVITVISIIAIQKYKQSKSYFTYRGLYGDYYIQQLLVENTTLYRINTDVGNRKYIITLRNSPYDVENITMEPQPEKAINRKGEMLYITKDPEIINATVNKATIAIIEFGRILGTNEYGIYQIPTKSANTKFPENNLNSTTPVITCDNVTDQISVIYVKLGNKNEIYTKSNCLVMEATDGDNLLKVADKFAYHLLGFF